MPTTFHCLPVGDRMVRPIGDPVPRPPAERRTPSEILEPFRNLGRFPPGHSLSFRRRLPSNHSFQHDCDLAGPPEEWDGTGVAFFLKKRCVQDSGKSDEAMERHTRLRA